MIGTSVLSVEPIRKICTTPSLPAPLCGHSAIDLQSGGLISEVMKIYLCPPRHHNWPFSYDRFKLFDNSW